jgi:hypothetical protein
MIMYLTRLLKIGLYEQSMAMTILRRNECYFFGCFFVQNFAQNSSKLWLPIDSSIIAGD